MAAKIVSKTRLLPIAGAFCCALALILLLFVSMDAAPNQSDPSSTAQFGMITGRITTSDGGDWGEISIQAFRPPVSNVAASTTPDATGHYTFADLIPGDYRIFVSTGLDSRYLSENYDNKRGVDNYDPVVLPTGGHVSGIDIELQLGGIITGQVTDEATGAPLAGIVVLATGAGGIGSIQAETTDALGRYEVYGLRTADYHLCFSPEDEKLTPYLSECYDNTSVFQDRKAISVVEGVVVPDINAELTLGGMIQGRVTSELTGEPLAGIRVRAEPVNVDGSALARTDASGNYTITTLLTDTYRVYFSGAPNYGSEYYDNQPTSGSATPVAVTPYMTVTGIDAALPFVVNFTGRVINAHTEQPIKSVSVYIYDSAGDLQEVELTEQTGEYTATGLLSGTYSVLFHEDGFRSQFYANRILFNQADPVVVISDVVLPNINAALIPKQDAEVTLATAATRPDVLFAVRDEEYNPIFSTDGGQSWQTLITVPFKIDLYPPEIAVIPRDDPAQPLRLLLGNAFPNFSGGHGIYRSGDNGATWAAFVPPGDPRCEKDDFTVDHLYVSPVDPQRVYMLAHCTKTIINLEPIDVAYYSIYVSLDGGVTWQPRIDISTEDVSIGSRHAFLLPSPVIADRVYARHGFLNSGKVWRRSDNGAQTWITETFTVTELALDWVDSNRLYAVDDIDTGDFSLVSNLFRYIGKRSTNGGATWEEWPQQPCRTSFQQLLALPAANSLLVLCDEGLYRSTNAGDSWDFLTAETDGTLSVHNEGHLILWVRGAKIYGSTDQGTTWSDLGGWQNAFLPSLHRE